MKEIITDQSVLRQVSKPVNYIPKDTMNFLIENIISNEHAAGLAAPQIGVFERIFIAKLSMDTFIFINPELTNASKDKMPFVEGCLSLPNIKWCVNRHKQITINAEYIYILQGNLFDKPSDNFPNGIRVRDFDAALVQHEYDHLEGILMIDHPQSFTREELITQRKNKRAKRLEIRKEEKRTKKDKKKNLSQKISAKRASALKKSYKSAIKRMKKRVKIQEYIRAEEENLFAD